MRSRGALVGAALVGAVSVVGAQAFAASRREYLPEDPGYVVDGMAEPAGGGASDPVRLAVLGDSTVAGLGSPTPEESLPMLIARRVADAIARPVQVRGFGVSGARTADIVALQAPLLGGERWDAVIAVVGANDVTHLTAPWALARQTRELAVAVAAPVVIGGIPLFGVTALGRPLRDVVGGIARLQRDAQRRGARAGGAALVEIARDASPRFAGVPEAMSWDGYHPAPAGYGFWADAIAPVVVDVVRQAPCS